MGYLICIWTKRDYQPEEMSKLGQRVGDQSSEAELGWPVEGTALCPSPKWSHVSDPFKDGWY